jgi:hypothetical protein
MLLDGDQSRRRLNRTGWLFQRGSEIKAALPAAATSMPKGFYCRHIVGFPFPCPPCGSEERRAHRVRRPVDMINITCRRGRR